MIYNKWIVECAGKTKEFFKLSIKFEVSIKLVSFNVSTEKKGEMITLALG